MPQEIEEHRQKVDLMESIPSSSVCNKEAVSLVTPESPMPQPAPQQPQSFPPQSPTPPQPQHQSPPQTQPQTPPQQPQSFPPESPTPPQSQPQTLYPSQPQPLEPQPTSSPTLPPSSSQAIPLVPVVEKKKSPVRSRGYDYLVLEEEEEEVVSDDLEDDEFIAVEEESIVEQDDDLALEEEVIEEDPVVVEDREDILEEHAAPLLVEHKEEILPEEKREGPYLRSAGGEYLVLEGIPELEETDDLAVEESAVEHDEVIAFEEEEEVVPEKSCLPSMQDEHLAFEEEVEEKPDVQVKSKLNPSLRSFFTKPLQQYSGSFSEKGVASKKKEEKKVVAKAEKKRIVNTGAQPKAEPKSSVRSIITKPLQHYTEAWSLLTPFFQQPISLKGLVTPSVEKEEAAEIHTQELLAEAEDPAPEEPEEEPSAEEAMAEEPLLSQYSVATTPLSQNPPVVPSRRSTGEKWNNYPAPKRVSAYGVAGEGPLNVDSYFALQAMFAPQYPAYSVVPLVEATGYYFVDNTYGASLGVGGRYLPETLPMLIGFNTVALYYQGQHGPLFECGLGVEFIAKRWGVYAQGFIPTGNQVNKDKHSYNKIGGGFKASCTQIESTLTGFVSQASLLAYQGGDFFLYLSAGPYFLSVSNGGHKFWGGQFIIQPRLNDIFSISLIINQDSFLGTTVQGEFVLSFPLYSLSRLKKYKGYRKDRWINRQVYQPFYRAGPLPIDRMCCWDANF